MASKLSNGASSFSNYYLFDPDKITIITDVNHPLYDERINLPIDEALVKNIMVWGPREPIECRKNGKDANGQLIIEVIDGRRRTLHTREANKRLVAQGGEPWPIKVIFADDIKDDGDLLALSVLHNEQRFQDPPSVKAQKCARLLAKGKTVAEVANTFGVSNLTIYNWRKLMSCSPEILADVDSGKCPQTIAVKLSDLSRDEQNAQWEKLKAEGNVSGKAAYEAAAEAAGKPKKTKKNAESEPRMRTRKVVEGMLEKFTARDVRIDDLPNARQVLKWMLGDDAAIPSKWTDEE